MEMNGNGLKWLDMDGNALKFLKGLDMCKIPLRLLWPEKCQEGVTWGFRSQTGTHC